MPVIALRPKARLTNGETLALECEISRRETDAYTLYDIAVRNPGPKPLTVDRIEIFHLDFGVSRVEVFRQGFYSPSDSAGFYILAAGEKAPQCLHCYKPDFCDTWDLVSHSLAVASVPGRRKRMLFGFTSGRDFEGLFVFRTRGKTVKLTGWCRLDGISLKPGAWLKLEPLMVAESADFNELLDRYATLTAETNRARVPKKTVTGWSDWQFYREEKCEADVLRSLKTLKVLKQQGYPLRYVMIDGGWCDYSSEWFRPCKKFPSGMKKLSQIVRRAGFELGI